MTGRRSFRRSPLALMEFERRLNPSVFLVTNTADYWLDGPPLNPSSDPIVGSFRWAIAEAREDYEESVLLGTPVTPTITFSVSSLGGKTDFSVAQTINLDFGSLVIDTPVIIRGPRVELENPALPLVAVKWSASPFTDPYDPIVGDKYSTDWSVFQIGMTSAIDPRDLSVALGGLSISKGIADFGAGVFYNGNGNGTLTIAQCEISNHLAI